MQHILNEQSTDDTFEGLEKAWVANSKRGPETVCLQSRSPCPTTMLRSLTATSLCFNICGESRGCRNAC